MSRSIPFLVLLVESICMISVAIVASVFGLYWSGDIGGRWAADMHVSMLAGGGFFTSVLMATQDTHSMATCALDVLFVPPKASRRGC